MIHFYVRLVNHVFFYICERMKARDLEEICIEKTLTVVSNFLFNENVNVVAVFAEFQNIQQLKLEKKYSELLVMSQKM